MDESNIVGGPTLADTSRRPPSPQRARLLYIGSPEAGFEGAGRSFPLADLSKVQFGRDGGRALSVEITDDELRISLPFPWVSGAHAELDFTEPAPVLRDRGSRNGTLVEGRAIREVEIGEGEVFEIGRSFWMVRNHRDAEDRTSTIDPTGVANPAHAETLQALERLASTRVPILLTGETGSGKDYLAQAIHVAAGRGGPLVRANVLARPLEEQLFGSGKSGGLIERARGGTLLLDDVGELPASEQAQLVSALLTHIPTESGELRLADDEIRLVSSSTRNLRAMVNTDGFRGDLYARLAGYECVVPPLRARREDHGLLVRALAHDDREEPVPIAVEVFREIVSHPWPFNVRELRHSLRTSIALSDPVAGVTHDEWTQAGWPSANEPTPARIASVRHALVRELAEHRGDTQKVARSLKCDVADIERWLERFALEPNVYAAR